MNLKRLIKKNRIGVIFGGIWGLATLFLIGLAYLGGSSIENSAWYEYILLFPGWLTFVITKNIQLAGLFIFIRHILAIIIGALIGIFIQSLIPTRKKTNMNGTIKIFTLIIIVIQLSLIANAKTTELPEGVFFEVTHLSRITNNGLIPFYIKIINNYDEDMIIKNISIATASKIIYSNKTNQNLKPYIINETYNSIKEEGVYFISTDVNFQEIVPENEFKVEKKVYFYTTLVYEKNDTDYEETKKTSIKIAKPLPRLPKPSPNTINESVVNTTMSILAIPQPPSSFGEVYYGDLHVHTTYTDCDTALASGISTVQQRKNEALALSLDWLSLTDHSYCLTLNDGWYNFKNDVHNAISSSFLILHSEELSVGEDCPGASETNQGLCQISLTCSGYAAHMGAHNVETFVSDSPSSCPVGTTLRCPSSPGSQEGINLANSYGGFAIINHPFTELDVWDWKSFSCTSNYVGLEAWSSDFNTYDQYALDYWINNKLLVGVKNVFIYGGSDSEPCTLGEKRTSTIGPCSTDQRSFVYNGCLLDSFSEGELENAIRKGRCFVSNNGYLLNYISTPHQSNARIGDEIHTCSGDNITLSTYYGLDISSCNLVVKTGKIGDSIEYNVGSTGYISGSGSQTRNVQVSNDRYYRTECISSDSKKRIYTNPIWVKVHVGDSDGDGTCDYFDRDKALLITNLGTSNLQVSSITKNVVWITGINPTSFTLTPSESRSVGVTINSGGYSSGSYTGTISINSNDPDENPKTVPVTMNIYCVDNDKDNHNLYNPTWCPTGGDCNDNNAIINPSVSEICNGIDDNCDSVIDPENSLGCVTYYKDNDNDGYGQTAYSKCLCSTADPYDATNSNDCNDANSNINPGKAEVCNNGMDDDCDNKVDLNDPDCVTCTDNDGDGYKKEGGVCGTVDCNDNNANIYPGATEILCDGIDQDCSGGDNTGTDVDGDGYKINGGLCGPIDCNDLNANVNPGRTESCNGLDDNCNNLVDEEGANGCVIYYKDYDNDGYGVSDQKCLCSTLNPFRALQASDCNDNNAEVNPGAFEICNDNVDNDCDLSVDESGCSLSCNNIGSEQLISNELYYCDIDKILKPQKVDGVTCYNNFECINNFCSNNLCVNIGKILTEEKSLLQQIIDLIKNKTGWNSTYNNGLVSYHSFNDFSDSVNNNYRLINNSDRIKIISNGKNGNAVSSANSAKGDFLKFNTDWWPIINNDGQATISFWAKQIGECGDIGNSYASTMIGRGSIPGNYSNYFALEYICWGIIYANKTNLLWGKSNPSDWVLNELSGTVARNSWHHYFIEINKTYLSYWIDNSLVNSFNNLPTNGVNWAANDSYVFHGLGAYKENANVTLDELAIWNRFLSDEERNSLYNNGNGIFYPT